MSDLISRQAVRFVEMDGKKEHPTFNLDDAYEQGFEDCLEKVLALPSIDAEPPWIPCSEVNGEGYPKEDGFYYVTERNYGFYLDADSKQNVAHTSHFNGDFTDRFYDENHSNIVAWMPLPKPYEERKEE